MAVTEIPFTRTDFLQLLTGCFEDKLYNLFLRALANQLLTGEVVTGKGYNAQDLLHLMAQGRDYGHFMVPEYLYSALKDAQSDEETPTILAKFHGVVLHPWLREFIVADVKWDKLESRPAVDEGPTAPTEN